MQALQVVRAGLRSGAYRERLRPAYGRQVEQGERRLLELTDLFQREFAAGDDTPVALYSAAGRTELGGNHTDHQRGRVLTASISLDTIACVARRQDRLVRHQSLGHELVTVDLDDLAPREAERETVFRLTFPAFTAGLEGEEPDCYFQAEIVPVAVPQRKGDPLEFKVDEHPRAGSTVEVLAKLRPAFKEGGVVTAGNASGINDGAAALVLASEELVKKHQLRPLARVVSSATTALDPWLMGLGPVEATRKALHKANWMVSDLDLIELNEAFASQALACIKDLELDPQKVNIQGGAIALGHPIGASGARILTTLIYALRRTGGKRGLATLCVGGGMGVAMCVELV